MIFLTDLPQLNAILNTIATLLLFAGYIFIRKKKKDAHMKIMWSAFIVSFLFLISYLTFHFQVGSVGYDGTGWVRIVYFLILISHILLAMINFPMVLITMYLAMRKDYQKHKKIARWTWPVWMYVSVTGIIVYLMMEASDSYDKLFHFP